jgi:hypothetical protein
MAQNPKSALLKFAAERRFGDVTPKKSSPPKPKLQVIPEEHVHPEDGKKRKAMVPDTTTIKTYTNSNNDDAQLVASLAQRVAELTAVNLDLQKQLLASNGRVFDLISKMEKEDEQRYNWAILHRSLVASSDEERRILTQARAILKAHEEKRHAAAANASPLLLHLLHLLRLLQKHHRRW